MRRNIVAWLSLLTVISCASDMIGNGYASEEVLTIPVKFVDEYDSGSTLDDSAAAWHFIWEDGDKVNCILTRLGRTISNPIGTINVSNGKTTVTLGTTYSNGDVLYSWASSGGAGAATGSVASGIQGSKVLQEGQPVFTPVRNAMPLVAVPMPVNKTILKKSPAFETLQFSMLGSIVKLQISSSDTSFAAGERIQLVSLTSAGQAIAGDFNYNLASNSLTASGLTEKTVTAKLSDYDSMITCDGYEAVIVYMVVAPGTFAATLNIRTDKAEYTVDLPEATFHRGKIKTIPVVLSGDTADVAASFDILA